MQIPQQPDRRTSRLVEVRLTAFPEKGFTEPVTLSSTVSIDFPLSALRLPRTAFGDDFDLLASRARCKGEPIQSARVRSRGRADESAQRARTFVPVDRR